MIRHEKLESLVVLLYNSYFGLGRPLGIQNNIDDVESILISIEECCPDQLQEAVNSVKEYIQAEARYSVVMNQNKWGLLAMATGSGKSKVPIDSIKRDFIPKEGDKILIVVPTEKLRDTGWRDEFIKWGAEEIYDKYVETTCYASLHNYVDQCFRYVIGDEFHNITEAKVPFFKSNTIEVFFGLSATIPRRAEKIRLLEEIGVNIAYKLSLDDAVRLRLVAQYEFIVIGVDLDTVNKIYPAGNAQNRFYQSEAQAYAYQDKLTEKAPNNRNIFKRANMIKNLDSKQKAAKFVLENLLPPEERTLIFCGSIEQAIELCPNRYFARPSVSKKDKQAKKDKVQKKIAEYQGEVSLMRFIAKEITRLSCVERLNEGANIPELSYVLAVQINSNDKDLIQRLGRLIRYRVGFTGKFIILVSKKTKDVHWVNSALSEFDQSKIRWIEYSDLVRGIVHIN